VHAVQQLALVLVDTLDLLPKRGKTNKKKGNQKSVHLAYSLSRGPCSGRKKIEKKTSQKLAKMSRKTKRKPRVVLSNGNKTVD